MATAVNNQEQGINLKEIFRLCDENNTGYIDRCQLRRLCQTISIDESISDELFEELDLDRDGKINFQDFSSGFKEFVDVNGSVTDSSNDTESEKSVTTNGEPRGTIKGESRGTVTPVVVLQKNGKDGEVWNDFVSQLRQSSKHPNSLDRIKELEDAIALPTASTNSLISCFQHIFTDITQDVHRLQKENSRLENIYKRERRTHEMHLSKLEEEMGGHVRELEENQKKEREVIETERHTLREKMNLEMNEMQSHLNLFHIFNETWLKSEDRNREKVREMEHKLEEAVYENQNLRSSLIETQTSIAMLRTELAQLRSYYDDTTKQLQEKDHFKQAILNEKESLMKQVDLLHEANKQLKDVNDSITTSKPSQTTNNQADSIETSRGSVLYEYLNDIETDDDNSKEESSNKLEAADETSSTETDNGPVGSKTLTRETLEEGISHPLNYSGEWMKVEHSDIQDDECGSSLPRRRLTGSLKRSPFSKLAPVSFEETNGHPLRTYKVAFAGDPIAGKSSFINRICTGTFTTKTNVTFGLHLHSKRVSVGTSVIELELWDTAGQERFNCLTMSFFRGSHGIMLLYDATDIKSFNHIKDWLENIENELGILPPIVICANKFDLEGNVPLVPSSKGKRLAEDYSASFFETSVKNGFNVHEAVTNLIRQMEAHKKYASDSLRRRSIIRLGDRRGTLEISKKKKKCACG